MVYINFYTISLSLRKNNRWNRITWGQRDSENKGRDTWITLENDFWLESKATAVGIVMNEDVS
jgi:hypothetical protein